MRLGTDPEVFLQDATGKHISAIGFIGADKWNPLQIPGMEQGFTLQEDNVTLEFGIPPADSADKFVEYIEAVLAKSHDYIGNLTFSNLSCTIFPEDQMQHPAAHIFGCEPDFCAWTHDMNAKPRPPHPFMRSAGGHIHIETDQDPEKVVRCMDLFHGVPATLMDKGEERKKLYGKWGAFRPKPYGVEYRTPSNFWIFKPELIRWTWRACERALAFDAQGDVQNEANRIFAAVNGGDKDVARQLCHEYNIEVIE